MSEGDQTIKLAGMYPPKNNNAGKQKPVTNNDIPIKYCYNFNESGECRFGASCIYSHARDPNHTTREPRAKPVPEPHHPPNPVGKDTRTPNGVEKIRRGYLGKNPRVRFHKANSIDGNTSFKSLIVSNESLENTSSSSIMAFKSWADIDEKPFVVVKEFINNVSMNMIRAEDIGFSDTVLRDSLTTTKGFSSMSAHDLNAIIEDDDVFS